LIKQRSSYWIAAKQGSANVIIDTSVNTAWHYLMSTYKRGVFDTANFPRPHLCPATNFEERRTKSIDGKLTIKGDKDLLTLAHFYACPIP
jgi:polyisoprenoid-binding protein YceI